MSGEIGVVVGLILAAAAVLLVARPLRREPETTGEGAINLEDLLARRETAYQILRDLDSDFQTGKLSEDDYRPMRVQALAQAAELVAQIDAYRPVETPSPVQKSGGRSASPKAAAFCPHCGADRQPDDTFCRKCGHKLKTS